MEMIVHVHGDVATIELSDPIRLGAEDELPVLVAGLLERGFVKFLLNLHKVRYMDSRGLDGIVRAYTMVTKVGGRLKLVNVQKRIRELLDLTKLSPIFEMLDSEEQALASFGTPVSAIS